MKLFDLLFGRLIDRRIAEYQNDLITKHCDEVENIYKTMRGWRHDYHNHIQAMKALNLQNRTFALIENGSWASKSGDLMQKFINEQLKNMTVLNERLSIASSMGADKAAELEVLADAIVESVQSV